MKTNDLKLQKGFWYLATPYSKYAEGIDAAAKHAAQAAGQLLAGGIHVYSPIAHTHAIAKEAGLDPYDHGIFMLLDHQMMAAAEGCLVIKMPGWEQSKGVKEEIDHFSNRSFPVIYLEWPLVDFDKHWKPFTVIDARNQELRCECCGKTKSLEDLNGLPVNEFCEKVTIFDQMHRLCHER